MGGKPSREKGKRGEREAAKALSDLLGLDVRRGVQYQGGPDSPDVVGIPGVHVEVKRTERLQLMPAIQQAQEDAREGDTALVMWRRSRSPWIVCLPLDGLLGLSEAIQQAIASKPSE